MWEQELFLVRVLVVVFRPTNLLVRRFSHHQQLLPQLEVLPRCAVLVWLVSCVAYVTLVCGGGWCLEIEENCSEHYSLGLKRWPFNLHQLARVFPALVYACVALV